MELGIGKCSSEPEGSAEQGGPFDYEKMDKNGFWENDNDDKLSCPRIG